MTAVAADTAGKIKRSFSVCKPDRLFRADTNALSAPDAPFLYHTRCRCIYSSCLLHPGKNHPAEPGIPLWSGICCRQNKILYRHNRVSSPLYRIQQTTPSCRSSCCNLIRIHPDQPLCRIIQSVHRIRCQYIPAELWITPHRSVPFHSDHRVHYHKIHTDQLV